ncbi:hypothetical protein HUT06_00480 [Actinomadura sp. NAK00032]|uniref:hypothetical protein n=1 Tax=Actinomadura sp. NAK00032 TaxID=2742128 RepID=UPI0015922C64|nr:hypothetical protein [Actinomadura sp. NAK00032]QKW32695.1 hypothetical protein HUT06_00480 [Actinomadura sp. NAK00032]
MRRNGLVASLGRLRRRIGFDGNELRRPVDRRQRTAGLLLLFLFLGVGLPVCGRVVEVVYDAGVRTERYEAVTRYQVHTTVLRVEALRTGNRLTVMWWDVDGRLRTDSYETTYAAAVGEQLELWADPEAVSDRPPRRHAQTVGESVGAGLGTLTAAGSPLLAAYLWIRTRCDQRRDRLWDADWEQLDADRSR